MIYNYKLIKDFNTEQEQQDYFNRLTAKRIRTLKDNYILLGYNSFLHCYVPFDYKLSHNNKIIFDSDPSKYCY